MIFVSSFISEYVVAPETNCIKAINAKKAVNNFVVNCIVTLCVVVTRAISFFFCVVKSFREESEKSEKRTKKAHEGNGHERERSKKDQKNIETKRRALSAKRHEKEKKEGIQGKKKEGFGFATRIFTSVSRRFVESLHKTTTNMAPKEFEAPVHTIPVDS